MPWAAHAAHAVHAAHAAHAANAAHAAHAARVAPEASRHQLKLLQTGFAAHVYGAAVFPKTRIVMGLLTILGALVRESLVGMADLLGSLPPGHIVVVVGKDYFSGI